MLQYSLSVSDVTPKIASNRILKEVCNRALALYSLDMSGVTQM
jgi:hypothetical protein